jgi:hypothetical protein
MGAKVQTGDVEESHRDDARDASRGHRHQHREEPILHSPKPLRGTTEHSFAASRMNTHRDTDQSTESNSSVIVAGNDATMHHDDEGSVSRIEDLSDHNGATPFRQREDSKKRIPPYVGEGSGPRISPGSPADKPHRHSGLSALDRVDASNSEVKEAPPRHSSRHESKKQYQEPHQENPTQREMDAMQKISEEQKYRLMAAAYPELTHPNPHPAVSGRYPEDMSPAANHTYEYVHHTGAFGGGGGVQPGQGMEHLLHRMRLLEAESRARREQQAEDEKRLARCEGEWVSEITALRVQLSDVELLLDEERRKNRKLMSEMAAKESEIQTLRGE